MPLFASVDWRMVSQKCESTFPFMRVMAVAALLAGMFPAASPAAPEDDYKRGETAYRSGDMVGAMAVLRRAADQGHAPSQVLLGDILDRAEFDEEALAYYRKAAEQGDPAGEFGVGSMYLAGEGVKKDPQQAYFWFTRAAEKNHVSAIIGLANAYISADQGTNPVWPDQARAAQWLRKAAEADYLPAVEALAQAYRAGGFAIAQDATLAERYAAQGAALKKKQRGDPRRKK